MMTHELEVSILAAPVAAMDRGALSQAWYSALHLAQRSPQQRQTGTLQSVHDAAQHQQQSKRPCAQVTKTSHSNAGAPTVSRPHDARPAKEASLDVSAARTPSQLSKRIELRFAANHHPVARATFSLGRGAARVHIIMQTNGSTARLVAICRPQMRDIVARALAEARLALNARGMSAIL